jgi:hypothetical protein
MTIRERKYWLDTVAEPATGTTGALLEISHIVLRRV